MSCSLKFIFILISVLNVCESARILIIMPIPNYSHHLPFNSLWLALYEQGHEITLLTTDPLKNIPNNDKKNFQQIDLSFTYDIWNNKHNMSDIIHNFNTNMLKSWNQFANLMNDIFDMELKHEKVQNIINDKNKKFDLVIAELLHPGMLVFSHRFNCPSIGVSPMDIPLMGHNLIGNPTNPALYSDFGMPFDIKMSFFERVQNTLYYIFNLLYFKHYFYPTIDRIIAKHFDGDYPKIEEIQRNASMVFINTNFVLHDIRPLLPNVIPLGIGMHLNNSNESLPNDLKTFLDSANDGAILISLGTNIKSQYLSEDMKRTIVEILNELPYKVLWKLDEANLVENSKILIKPWLPQRAILAHKNMKLFISHGGLRSLEEALYNRVPIIGIPFFVDQHCNLRRLKRKGIALGLNYRKLNKKDLKTAILQIMNDPSFKEKATYWSGILKDYPISPLKEATHWVNYVLKNKGAKFLKRPEIPLYQFFLLDVGLFSVIILCLSVYLWYKTTFILIRWIIRRRRTKLTKID